jgi:hypothetical protein
MLRVQCVGEDGRVVFKTFTKQITSVLFMAKTSEKSVQYNFPHRVENRQIRTSNHGATSVNNVSELGVWDQPKSCESKGMVFFHEFEQQFPLYISICIFIPLARDCSKTRLKHLYIDIEGNPDYTIMAS